MQDFLLKTIFWLAFAIGLLIVLSFFGVNITPLFAVLGGASFILAFAMQETLGNLAAGLMIMINKPFDVGDLVDTNGILGEVEAVSIVSTTVRTLDNQVVILPNSAVWGSIITNVTVSPVRRVDMVFGIGYGDDMEKAQKILERVVSENKLILDDPQPNIRVHELADSSVNFICRPWTKTEHYWDVYWDLTRKVKENFDAEGVSIPFPQRDVHLFQEPGS
jgi:small conductance mechanosensitive channel